MAVTKSFGFSSGCGAICLLLLLCINPARSCIYEYGDRKEAAIKAGVHFDYGYNGLDWVNLAETCKGGTQSPIMLPTTGSAAAKLPKAAAQSTFNYGPLVNPTITNNGHTLQVVFPADFKSDVKIPIVGDKKTALGASILGSGPVTGSVKATPAQFHFHSHSEHVINGASYPLEMHIVHFIKPDQLPACPAPGGCPTVLGIMFALTEDESEVSPELRRLINTMPLNEQETAAVKGTIDLNTLLPKNRTYLTYPGSLTTPPCTEGILWHVLATPMKISQSLLTKYEEAVGDTFCPEKEGAKPAGAMEQAAKATIAAPKERAMVKAAESSGANIFKAPAADGGDGCIKLANGHNFRDVQPVNGRTVKIAVN